MNQELGDPNEVEVLFATPEREWAPRRPEGGRQHHPGQNGGYLMRYKAEFPLFDYDHPHLWITRCERFFMLSHIPRGEILNLLFVNLSGKVGLWYEGYVNGLREGFQWPHFEEVVCRRFRDSIVFVMEDFVVLKQTGGLDDFNDKYEEFKSLLLQSHPYLTDSYFLENYIARLKQNLRCFVRTAMPVNLGDAMWFAKHFDKGLRSCELPKTTTTWNPRPNQNLKTYNSGPSDNIKPNYTANPTSSTNQNTTTSTQSTATKIPDIAKFKAQLREQKKCFRCFEPWQVGHRCRGPTFNIIEEVELGEIVEEPVVGEDTGEGEVSLCAVVGREGMNTIKLLGKIQKQQIVILVESGSTHSFLDPKILNQLRKEAVKASPLTVTVANGEKMVCDTVCNNLEWQIQNEQFRKDFRLLRLGGCDMVLGMDWVDIFAPIQLHTRPAGISFHKDGKKVFLKGLPKRVMLKEADEKQLRKWKKTRVQGFLVQCQDTSEESGLDYQLHQLSTQEQWPELTQLIEEFTDFFEEPKTLPPQRSLDHSIPLVPGAKAINLGPYRYSYDQKNIIEKMVGEMLDSGIIVPSSSPFASPVLLV
ncbi:PREDICTED: uncharacterized protein LOC109174389 [Ipomoea nil]|uniref:uncharacterized protein LOC109174389 n=1 Tax=Ipomoea nil TaxID=35883 RepID=UPI000901C355|nr:PREDICTED: uncharacterized protein LOC109174389 [Ipomoea nil]